MEIIASPLWLQVEPLLQVFLILFVLIFVRYLVISGVYHYVFFIWLRAKFSHRIINAQPKKWTQVRMEIRRSALTSLVFSLSGTGLFWLWQHGHTHITTEWSAYPWWYHPMSLLLALFIHETYYYWLHRWMHRPRVYRKIHKWHHDSIETTSLTSFSFHPLESILQAIIIPFIVIFLPMHAGVLLTLLIIMTASGTINHAGVEIYPSGFQRHPVAKWIIGATHHDLHHKQFRYNFGLYFTFWDKWMGTESPDYETTFEQEKGAGS